MPEKNSRMENLKDKEKKVTSASTKKTSEPSKTSTKEAKSTSRKNTKDHISKIDTEKKVASKTSGAKKTSTKEVETKTEKSKVKETTNVQATQKASTNSKTANKNVAVNKVPTEKEKATNSLNKKSTTSNTKKATNSTSTKKGAEKTTTSKTKSKSNLSSAKTEKKNEVPAKKVEETKKVKKVEAKKQEVEEIKPKESAIISKIKSFLKKIVELQEEAKKEKLEQKEKVAKELEKKENKEIAKEKKNTYSMEYYDLPYRYNETVVKILAQTPKRLFVYWDVADSDRERYIKAFGENFFNDTYPVLLIHNDDRNYTFEVPINDFANSWYLDINDSKSKYTIQLGRKFKDQARLVTINREQVKDENIVLQNDYLPITTSNTLEVPNDHILFENLKPYVVYRNVKNYNESIVDISNLEFAKKMGKIYNIYEVYKEIYKKEMEDESLLDLLNPSSMSSSSFK